MLNSRAQILQGGCLYFFCRSSFAGRFRGKRLTCGTFFQTKLLLLVEEMGGLNIAAKLALLAMLLQGNDFIGDAFVLAPRSTSANTCELLSTAVSARIKDVVVCWCASSLRVVQVTLPKPAVSSPC